MSLWFTASAVSPQLAALWGLDATQTAWLTTSVQLGFVAGTALAALLNLADILLVLWGFADNWDYCTVYNVEMYGCVPELIIDLDEVLAVLNAFARESFDPNNVCPNPCP